MPPPSLYEGLGMGKNQPTMKKFTLLISLLTGLLSTQLNAQDTKDPYIPILGESIKWHLGVLGEFYDYSAYYLSLGDTEIIDEKEYTQIIADGVSPIYAYLREDIDERKIYKSGNPEVVLYDFSLELGDTFNIGSGTYTVDAINYIETYDGPRKAWYLSAGLEGDLTPVWVEGIGSMAGILHPEIQPNLDMWDFPELLCFEDDEVMVYKSVNGENYGCQLESIGIEENNTNLQIEVFPNPTTGKIYLRFPSPYLKETDSQFQIIITNVLGKEMLSQKLNTQNERIDVSHLSQGVYLLNITDKNQKQLLTKKLIKL